MTKSFPAVVSNFRFSKPLWWAQALASLFGAFSCYGHAAIQPVGLSCECRINPVGIDKLQPRLGWVVEANDGQRGASQSAYQVLVSGSRELLDKNRGDLWDSGKVDSDQSVQIVYGGINLVSGKPCFWKVRLWDQNTNESQWSAPAKWTMGLLRPEDWRAKWIGLDQGENTNLPPSGFEGSQWIWFPEGNPTVSAPVAGRYFRRILELPENQAMQEASIHVMADDEFTLFINGIEVGKERGNRTPHNFAVDGRLKPGRNVLAIEARNVGKSPNPAGLIARLEILFTQGNTLTLDTDENWKAATNCEAGWNAPVFDDAAWVAAKPLGEYGIAPWAKVKKERDRRLPARYLRREFTADKRVRSATAHVCGLGLSELYLDGRKVSDDVLSPALSEYDQRAFYRTFDVTDFIKRGANAIGVILGNGRYFAPRLTQPTKTITFGYPKLLLQLNIDYADGTTAQIISDENWKVTAKGPIGANNEYDGEEYDARLKIAGWCSPKFDDSGWQPVELVQPAAPVLSAQIGEPIRVMETLHPVTVTNTRSGTYIFDMGQNLAGWCRLKVAGARGTKVTLRYAEWLLPDGTLSRANLRSAKAEDSYTLKGQGTEIFEPRFTYHGFRYVEVTGYPGKPSLDAIEGRVVHDALPTAGEFACSNPLLNQIHHNIYWGTRDNYRSIPTDCPQRDERQGWLGDRSAESKGETYLFNIEPLYSQWLLDMHDSQHTNGSVPDVAPAYWPFYHDGVVWPSSYVIIPHMMYEQYGDLEVLREHYDSMKKWTDYMTGFLQDGIMPKNEYGDWCVPPESPTEIHSSNPAKNTSGPLLSTAYFYYAVCLMARSARLLGKAGDVEHFDLLASQMKTAFNRHFYNSETGFYDNGTQTSCVLPLAFGMVPEDCRSKVFAHLISEITDESHNHIGTGLVGGQYLMRVLSDNGRFDLAYTIATQKTYPSWGYMITTGATTMRELWNGDTAAPGMNSGNHVMLIGDLNIWLHEYLGGIRPDPEKPGFKHVIIKPEIIGDLTWAKASYNSIHGLIVSNWKLSDGKFHLDLTIPGNCKAKVYLPAKALIDVTENNQPIEQAKGVTFLRLEEGRGVLETTSGHYAFDSQL